MTTDDDRLLEVAAAGAGRPLAVLPFGEAAPGPAVAARAARRRPARRLGTVLALTEDPARARLWSRTSTPWRSVTPACPSERRPGASNVLLDLVGCLASAPTGYLLDPAYRGMLDEQDAELAAVLTDLGDRLRERPRTSEALTQVDQLLRRLGAG